MTSTASESTKLRFKPLHPTFVAEAEGIDWTKPIPDSIIAQIQEGMDKYGVLIFRKANIDNKTQIAFTARFGELDTRPVISNRKDRFPGQPEIFDVSNLDENGGIVTEENPVRLMFSQGNGIWHADMQYHPRRDKYSILRAVEIPPSGGETMYADSRSIYDELSPEWKGFLKDRVVSCSLLHNRRQAAPELYKGVDPFEWSMTRYKAIYPHPGSGRTNLYLTTYAYQIDGLSIEETEKLVAEILEFGSQPRFTYKAEWKQAGDMIMWDNTAVWHKALDDAAYRGKYRRDMRRTNTRDNGPYAWGENEPGKFWIVSLPPDPLAHLNSAPKSNPNETTSKMAVEA